MFEIREARLSLKRDIQDIFTSGSIFSEVYNIYDEDDLRTGTTPTFPYVYLMDSWVIFEANNLPVIVIETDYDMEEFQLGSEPFGYCRAYTYVFGKDRGQRDDVAAAIMRNVTEVHIRDFDTDGYPIQNTCSLLPFSGKKHWIARDIPVPQELAFEKTLLNCKQLECHFWAYLT